MPLTARAFWVVAPEHGEIRAESLDGNAFPASQGLWVETLFSGISRGTEALVFQGRVPPGQYETMRAPLMAGDFPFPVKYGYSAVGLLENGQRVFVLHPHQDRFIAPEAMCLSVPDSVPDMRATLAANMETALNILWDAQPLAGERITVIGAGVVGLLTGYLCARMPAATVTLVDIDPSRAALAAAFGCRFALPENAPGEQELIIHASASEAGLRLALSRAAFEARIVEASWFGDRNPSLPLGDSFHQRRLRIISSQVGAVAAAMRGRRTYTQRLAIALDLLADPVLDLLVQSRTPFDKLPERMGELLRGGLCHVVTYGEH